MVLGVACATLIFGHSKGFARIYNIGLAMQIQKWSHKEINDAMKDFSPYPFSPKVI